MKNMGQIQIKKVGRKVVTGKVGENRTKVQKTYGKIIYNGTLGLTEMAAHIAKHGSVFTEDVVIGVITKLKNCIQEMLADGYKVKLDGIGTFYPVVTSEGVADADGYSTQANIVRVGVKFLADQSKRSLYKASAMKNDTSLTLKLYNELTAEDEEGDGEGGDPSNGGSGQGGSSQNNGSSSSSGSENQGGSQNSGNSGSSSSVAAPTISGTTPFDDSTQVTISGPAGSTIKYTTNGVAPTATYGNDYEEPITLNASATVKAVAIIDGVASEVATKQFTKNGSQGGGGEEGM